MGFVFTALSSLPTEARPNQEADAAYNQGRIKEAVAIYTENAEAGDVEAQIQLALIYSLGEGVGGRNIHEVIRWNIMAANNGSTEAAYELGEIYDPESLLRNYYGINSNRQESNKWYLIAFSRYLFAAGSGDLGAKEKLGQMNKDGKGVLQSYAEALRWWRSASDAGSASAKISIGFMFDAGKGVEKNFREARKWYLAAAEMNDVTGQYLYAMSFYRNTTTPNELAEALKWLLRAAEGHDDPLAGDVRRALAVAFGAGLGTKRDVVRAYMWYSLATLTGDDKAKRERAKLERQMAPAQINLAQRLAQKCQEISFKACM